MQQSKPLVAQPPSRPLSNPNAPWGSLVYFAAFALVLFGISLVVAKRRDA